MDIPDAVGESRTLEEEVLEHEAKEGGDRGGGEEKKQEEKQVVEREDETKENPKDRVDGVDQLQIKELSTDSVEKRGEEEIFVAGDQPSSQSGGSPDNTDETVSSTTTTTGEIGIGIGIGSGKEFQDDEKRKESEHNPRDNESNVQNQKEGVRSDSEKKNEEEEERKNEGGKEDDESGSGGGGDERGANEREKERNDSHIGIVQEEEGGVKKMDHTTIEEKLVSESAREALNRSPCSFEEQLMKETEKEDEERKKRGSEERKKRGSEENQEGFEKEEWMDKLVPLDSVDGLPGADSASHHLADQMMALMSQDDIQAVLSLQDQIFHQYRASSETLQQFNTFSTRVYAAMSRDFEKNTKTLIGMKKDLENVSKRIHALRRQLETRVGPVPSSSSGAASSSQSGQQG